LKGFPLILPIGVQSIAHGVINGGYTLTPEYGSCGFMILIEGCTKSAGKGVFKKFIGM
jgi:hypothetical protein